MFRKLVCALAVVAFSMGLAFADTIKGKVKEVDDEKKTITVTVDDKDSTYPVDKDAKIFTTGKAKKGQAAPEVALSGLRAVLAGQEVTVTTEKKNDKDTATAIKVEQAKKKKKKTT